MKKTRPPSARGAAKAALETPRAPSYDDLLAIVRLIESGSRFSEFRLRSGDIEVEIRRPGGTPSAAPPAAVPAPVARAQASAPPTTSPTSGNGAQSSAGATAAEATANALPPGTLVIRSPMVGTFYRAPAPDAAPFVEPGSRVEPDTILCIIEVMKLMNSVTAGVTGVVTHVFADNTQMVEYGQPLIALRPEP